MGSSPTGIVKLGGSQSLVHVALTAARKNERQCNQAAPHPLIVQPLSFFCNSLEYAGRLFLLEEEVREEHLGRANTSSG